jgi:hypothetical protein
MDPITIGAAISGATAAFNTIKQMCAAGRDLESCIGDVSRWMKAASDIDQAVKQSQNPPLFKKIVAGDSIEATALNAYAAKKRLEAQRQELKTFLNMTYGPQAWADLIQLEGRIRRERQEMIYKQQEMRQKVIEIIGAVVLSAATVAVLIAIVWMATR